MKFKNLLIVAFIIINSTIYSQWEEQNTSFSEESRGVQTISIVNPDVVWISSYDGSGAATPAFVRDFSTTSDGGTSWTSGTVSSNTNLRIAHINGVSDQVAYAVLFPGITGVHGAGIFQTTDGGATWNKQSSAVYNDADSFPNAVHFFDLNNGVCMGDPANNYFEIYTTTDGGNNWIRVPQGNIPVPLSGEYGYTGQMFSAGSSVWFTTNKGRIFKSDDSGSNWVVFQSPLSDFGGDTMSGEISFWDANNGVLININGGILKTVDGGENWTPINIVSGEVWGSDISCVPGTTGTIVSSGASHVAGSTDRGSSFSTDGGLNWTNLAIGNYIEVQFLNNTTGWVGSFTSSDTPPTGGIFKYTGSGLTAATNDNVITTFKAYPNPVKDILTIEGIDTITNVTVFNMLGQKVLNVNPNNTNATINMNSLNNGTYFAKVTINGATETMKIIK